MKFISVNNGLRLLFCSCTLAAFPLSALARAHASPSTFGYFQQTITGTVSDSSGPLPGVTIMVKGTNRSVISDMDGKFAIAASADEVLVFSFIGYQDIEVAVGEQNTIDISMAEEANKLEELEINAGYYSVKQKESTGSISRITAKDIEKQPVNNVLAAMQGRMAGVSITQSTGTAGGGFEIQIRGINSLRADGNSPLFIIDGVPYSSETIGYNLSNTIHPTTTSPLNNINPGDIESLEILKDADATAIYGSRGANGVVLVTTKKGKQGKMAFTANISSGFGSVTRFMKLMNTQQYLEMRREAFANDGIAEYTWEDYDLNGSWDQNRYTDWQKELLGGTAEITNINTSLSAGNEQTQFLVSGNFNRETTVFPGDFKYKKGNMRINLNHNSQDKRFNLRFSAGYTLQDNDQPSTDLTPAAWSTPPNAPAMYTETGELNWENNTFSNPLATQSGVSLSKTNDLVANAVLSYQLPLGFEIKSNFGYTSLNHQESSTFPSTAYNPAFNYGAEFSSAFLSNTSRQSWIAEPQVNWKKDLGKARMEIMAGSTFQRQNNELIAQSGTGFPSNSLLYNLAAASTVRILSDDETIYKYHAFFGRANLNWDGRFIVNLTGRRDGSSRFGPGKQFATFGAVGAAWILSNEKWLEGNSVLSFGKLRASYGTTGNDQIGNYQFLNTYSSCSSVIKGHAIPW